jgi:hypothetical protein
VTGYHEDISKPKPGGSVQADIEVRDIKTHRGRVTDMGLNSFNDFLVNRII